MYHLQITWAIIGLNKLRIIYHCPFTDENVRFTEYCMGLEIRYHIEMSDPGLTGHPEMSQGKNSTTLLGVTTTASLAARL